MTEKKVDVFIVKDVPLTKDEFISIKVDTLNPSQTQIKPIVTEKFIVPAGQQIKIKEIRVEYEIENLPPPNIKKK